MLFHAQSFVLLFLPATVVLYYLAFIPVALLHELGHAIVIRYHGGEVPEVVIRRNAHFAVLSNTTVLKGRNTSSGT